MAKQEQGLKIAWGPGPLRDALDSSYEGRLKQFIADEESEPIQIFSDEMREHSMSGDWYGEHAGKWLVAAAHAWRRTGSEELSNSIKRVVRFLIQRQEEDGYLGTYAPTYEGRLTNENASQVRTWDLWVHAWLILGLLEAHGVVAEATDAATKIGDLILKEFTSRSILDLGNHQGLSSAVLVHPLAELTIRTKNPIYAQFARQILQQMEDRGLSILSGPDQEKDISEIGTGKAYQLCWLLVGLTALYRATGEDLPQRAAEYWWENISEYHLTPMGGPCGGVGTHKEVFNQKGFFSPNGLTETCSTASWMALCRELFLLTGEARYIEAFETSLNNALLGAMDPNGKDWCYFTFPNGRRNNTYHWACCKSSGAMALEEAALVGATKNGDEISLNLWMPQRLTVSHHGQEIHILQDVGVDQRHCHIQVSDSGSVELSVAVRVPAGCSLVSTTINGAAHDADLRGDYVAVSRGWNDRDVLTIEVRYELAVNSFRYALDHHGQEIVRTDYAYLTWGPYVYATGLIDGYKKEETLRLARLTPESPFVISDSYSPSGFPVIELVQPSRPPIPFLPYFEAGGRHDGAWRAVWMQVAWQ